MSYENPNLPTAEDLATSRLRQWHQQGEAILTFENLRSWLNASGLVLFAPRAQQLPTPAPTMVEAVLGASNPNPTLSETEQAKVLLARAIAEGVAVPLNLLGTPGDTPDFVAAAPVFSYIFTLRGDKAWKQPPATSGAVKVSPLALATYNLLTERVTASAYDLATQLGKEVTESAVVRSLNELWSHLRVMPIPQQDGAPTLWELTTGRFTKLIKAGANAGQPSALSALISLYLQTALLATETEIETFLSPLAARSRVRDVVHALLSARQLETVAIEGRTMLHIAGAPPAFLAEVAVVPGAGEAIAEETPAGEIVDSGEETPRIKKFIPRPRKVGTGLLKKPAFERRATEGESRPPARSQERERRPFERRPKPDFTRPWQEEKTGRRSSGEDRGERKPFPSKPRSERGGDRPAFSRKPNFDRERSSDRPYRSDRPEREGTRAERPYRANRPERDGGRAERPYRSGWSEREGGRAERPSRGGFAGKPSFGRGSKEGRPPRREFGGERPAFGGPRRPGARPQAPLGEGRKPFKPRESGEGSDRPARRPRTEGAPFRRFDAPRGERPARREGAPAGRPKSGFAGKKPFGKPGAERQGKPAGAFDKFMKKPKRKPRAEEGNEA